jgi:hypothetical protein
MNKARIILDILIAVAVLNGWWFIALPLGIYGVWKFPGYIELICAGVAYDALFGFAPGMGWFGYIGTLTTALGTVLIVSLKKVMR